MPLPENFSIRPANIVGIERESVGRLSLSEFTVSQLTQTKRKWWRSTLYDMALRPEDLPVGQRLEQLSVWSNPADRLPFGFHCDASDEIFQSHYGLLAGQCKAIDRTRVQRRKHLVATSVREG